MIKFLKRARRYSRKRLRALRDVLADYSRYLKHSATFKAYGSRGNLQGLIIRQAHSVEVGMIYKPTRPGFAVNNVKALIRNLDYYIEQHGIDSLIVMSVETLQEYCNLNESLDNPMEEIQAETTRLNELTGGKVSRDREPTEIMYRTGGTHDFDTLARGRRSSREYTGEAEESVLREAAETALHSPSACNRQPCRIYLVTDPEKKRRVLDIQNNRSAWRSNASVLVVSSDLGMYNGMRERTAAWVDGGLFCMTLGYALNARGLGTCMLNLNVSEEEHAELRRILGASEAEVFIMMMAFGPTPGEVLVPKKYQRAVSEIINVC